MYPVARYRRIDGTVQSVREHLEGCSTLAATFAAKIGFASLGELLGTVHDLGKYSGEFQAYIKSAEGIIEPDDDEYVEADHLKGKIDHSTAGAQFLWKSKGDSPAGQIAAEIMALCIASHHCGLIDCLSPDGTDFFIKRMDKSIERTHYEEVMELADKAIIDRARVGLELIKSGQEFSNRLINLFNKEDSRKINQFRLGFLTRFLLSTLIDADRLNSAEHQPRSKTRWEPLEKALEENLSNIRSENRIDQIRAQISLSCMEAAAREKQRLYQLTVPTGGGKTLASLRFALRHAAYHNMDRIIYVVPYTSIIDQNARIASSIFKPCEEAMGQVVLEHHSNLTPERDTWRSKLLSENWDAPIIFTTAVQILETLFGSGTRGVRRLHQLANAILVFDEIQTIPIRMVHLFNNAINFLVEQCGSTVVFCTATQPLLGDTDRVKGSARLSLDAEMMPNVGTLFRDLKRTNIEDKCKPSGWSVGEVASLALQQVHEAVNVLVVVNKKAQARDLYQALKGKVGHLFHLSTNMCPAHRMAVLDEVKGLLSPGHETPLICVSTQLIEAGVDVDFGAVIRYLTGLDSIAQAAGRCNRNGLRSIGRVSIINAANENLDNLPEIRIAKEVTERVLREYRLTPEDFGSELQGPEAMNRYYQYYFFQRAHEMAFPISRQDIGRDDDLLNLLSENTQSVSAYTREHNSVPPDHHLRQSFMAAAKAFRAIESPAEGVIVPYGEEGRNIVAELFSSNYGVIKDLLRKAQRYSVNLFPHEVQYFKGSGLLRELSEGSGIFCLDPRHYSEEFGVSTEEVAYGVIPPV